MPEPGKLRKLLYVTLPGCWGALVFACLSFTPSLLPRSGLIQGVVCGITAVIGYGLGVLAASVWRAFADRDPRRPRRWAWRAFIISAAVLFAGGSGDSTAAMIYSSCSCCGWPLAIQAGWSRLEAAWRPPGSALGIDWGNAIIGGMIELRVLGPLEAQVAGRAADLGSRLQRAVLVLLLTESGRAVPADRMTGQLWRGGVPLRAIASLQAYVSSLRRLLEPGRPRRSPGKIAASRLSPAGGYASEVFIGREAELAALSAAAEETARGPGGVVLVTGEADVGKSGLLGVARGRLTAAGVSSPRITTVRGFGCRLDR